MNELNMILLKVLNFLKQILTLFNFYSIYVFLFIENRNAKLNNEIHNNYVNSTHCFNHIAIFLIIHTNI